MPVLPTFTPADVGGAIDTGARRYSGLMERSRLARRARVEDQQQDRDFEFRDFERELIRPVMVEKAKLDLATNAAAIKSQEYDARRKQQAVEEELDAQRRFEWVNGLTAMESKDGDPGRMEAATLWLSDFGGLTDYSPTIKSLADIVQKDVANMMGSRAMKLREQEEQVRQLAIQAEMTKRAIEVQKLRGEAAANRPVAPDRVQKWMDSRDQAVAEGRLDDAEDFQRIIDNYQPTGQPFAIGGETVGIQGPGGRMYDPETKKEIPRAATEKPVDNSWMAAFGVSPEDLAAATGAPSPSLTPAPTPAAAQPAKPAAPVAPTYTRESLLEAVKNGMDREEAKKIARELRLQ